MTTADTIFANGRLADLDASAMAVKDGDIVAIGTDALNTAAPETVDLGSAFVVPGLVEAHIYLDTSFYGAAEHVAEAVVAVPRNRSGYKKCRCIVSNGHVVGR